MNRQPIEATLAVMRQAAHGERFLDALNAGEAMIVLDVDGCLNDEEGELHFASPFPSAVRGVRMLSAVTPTALLSGRPPDYLQKWFRQPTVHLIGYYGSQWYVGDVPGEAEAVTSMRPAVLQAHRAAEMQARVAQWWLPGMSISNRDGVSFILEWRDVEPPAGEEKDRFGVRIKALATDLFTSIGSKYGLDLDVGSASVRLMVPGIDKRTSIHALRKRLEAEGRTIRAVFFLGDARQDIPGFMALDELEQLGLAVIRGLVESRKTPLELRSKADVSFACAAEASLAVAGLGMIAQQGHDLSVVSTAP